MLTGYPDDLSRGKSERIENRDWKRTSPSFAVETDEREQEGDSRDEYSDGQRIGLDVIRNIRRQRIASMTKPRDEELTEDREDRETADPVHDYQPEQQFQTYESYAPQIARESPERYGMEMEGRTFQGYPPAERSSLVGFEQYHSSNMNGYSTMKNQQDRISQYIQRGSLNVHEKNETDLYESYPSEAQQLISNGMGWPNATMDPRALSQSQWYPDRHLQSVYGGQDPTLYGMQIYARQDYSHYGMDEKPSEIYVQQYAEHRGRSFASESLPGMYKRRVERVQSIEESRPDRFSGYDDKSLFGENTVYECTSVITSIWTTCVTASRQKRHFDSANFPIHRNEKDLFEGKKRPLLDLDKDGNILSLALNEGGGGDAVAPFEKNVAEVLDDIKSITETAAQGANNVLSHMMSSTMKEVNTKEEDESERKAQTGQIKKSTLDEEQSLSTIFHSFDQAPKEMSERLAKEIDSKENEVQKKAATDSEAKEGNISNGSETATENETVWEAPTVLASKSISDCQSVSENQQDTKDETITAKVDELISNFFEELDDLGPKPVETNTIQSQRTTEEVVIEKQPDTSCPQDMIEKILTNEEHVSTDLVSLDENKTNDIALVGELGEEAQTNVSTETSTQEIDAKDEHTDISISKDDQSLNELMKDARDKNQVKTESLEKTDVSTVGSGGLNENWPIKIMIIVFYLYASGILGSLTGGVTN